MRILVVNDDGIDSPGILHLANWAKRLAEVTVCAPTVEQSGKSHAINFITPFEIKKHSLTDGVLAYALDSTPADCTRFGIIGLEKEYDLVLSGINRGVNMSGDVVYSGTAGAIFEAEHSYHRGIALSIAKDDPLPDFSVLDGIFKYIEENRLFDYSNLYNINIPKDPKGIRITKQGDAYFADWFRHIDGKENGEDGMYIQYGRAIEDTEPNDITRDTVAFREGFISVTPMTMGRTNTPAFDKLIKEFK